MRFAWNSGTISDPRRFAMAAALAVAILAMACAAQAQRATVYTVSGVAVDETGASAAAARDIALAKGQALAFSKLIDRLVPLADRSRVATPGPAELAPMVLGFEVENEKTSRVRYLARMTVRFAPGSVRSYLRDSGVRFAETRSKPLLVLPVYRTPEATLLWEENNSWRLHWAGLGPASGLVPLIVPAGSAEDRVLLSAQQALAGDPTRIARLAQRYGATDALLVAAAMVSAGGGSPVLDVTVSRFRSGGADRTMVRSFKGGPDSAPETLLQTAARELYDEIEEGWKRENLLRFDERQEMTVHAPLAGLPQWISLRARLNGVAAIQETRLVELSLDRATVRLVYLGDAQQLATALAQSDLELVRGAVDWEIRNRGSRPAPSPAPGAAPALRPPAAPGGTETAP